MSKKRIGMQLVLLSSLMFGSYGIWSRLMGNYFDPFFQGWSRSLIILIILVPILIFRREIVPINRKDWRWLLVFLIFTSMTQAPIYYAFNNMDIGSATLLFFSSMLFTMYTFGIIFLKEKLTLVKTISFIIAAFGLYLTYSFAIDSFTIFAAIMAILNGIASGGEVASSKKLSGDYSPLYLSALSWLIILVTNIPISLLLGETQHFPSLNIEWVFQIGYGLCGIIGFWAIIAGLKHIHASIGGLIGLSEIVFSIAFGAIIFHEIPSLQTVIGGCLILVAAGFPYIYDLISKKQDFS